MKLLLDQNISYRVVSKLRDTFEELYQVRELGLENKKDKEIWDFSKRNGFTIVTFDSDFFDFNILYGFPPKVIWLRTFNQSSQNIEMLPRKYADIINEFISDENQDFGCLEIK